MYILKRETRKIIRRSFVWFLRIMFTTSEFDGNGCSKSEANKFVYKRGGEECFSVATDLVGDIFMGRK